MAGCYSNDSDSPHRRGPASFRVASRHARRFAQCRLDFDKPFSSVATLPQSSLPSRPIRGYHLQTLITSAWLPYTSSLSTSPFPAPTFISTYRPNANNTGNISITPKAGGLVSLNLMRFNYYHYDNAIFRSHHYVNAEPILNVHILKELFAVLDNTLLSTCHFSFFL